MDSATRIISTRMKKRDEEEYSGEYAGEESGDEPEGEFTVIGDER